MDEFLNKHGWGQATRAGMTPDWSPRQYWRLAKNGGETAILLKGPEPELAGHGLAEFVDMAGVLRKAGLSAPTVYAQDLPHKLLLIEDFGDTPIDTPAIEAEAYAAAVDVLAKYRTIKADVVTYKDGYIFKKLALFSDDPRWMDAWAEAEAALPPAPQVFSHMDYKAGNLHWLPKRAGMARIGILDFQAAQIAPFTYDIVNLLEDARRNLDADLKAQLKARFKAALPPEWQAIFDDWYVFMAAQFHARVLGQIRGNPRVAADVAPRLEAYLATELKHPALAPVSGFFG
ncbi:MAG: phosphotransferase [Alphaproteobacteria bacterium]|nr:phosphotransferase [Alphaproteobacteria bacterium]